MLKYFTKYTNLLMFLGYFFLMAVLTVKKQKLFHPMLDVTDGIKILSFTILSKMFFLRF